MRATLFVALTLGLLALGAQCDLRPTPEPKPAPDVFVPPVLEPSGCERACARLADLGCEEGKPTDAGESCADVCANAAEHLDLECVARAQSCAEVDSCVR